MRISEAKFLTLHSLQVLPLKGGSPETGTGKPRGRDIPSHSNTPEAIREKQEELPDKHWKQRCQMWLFEKDICQISMALELWCY